MDSKYLQYINTYMYIMPGETVFKLYDTHGAPLDVIEEECLRKNILIDKVGFYKLLEKQKVRSRAFSKFKGEKCYG